jgi:hypothetical protein
MLSSIVVSLYLHTPTSISNHKSGFGIPENIKEGNSFVASSVPIGAVLFFSTWRNSDPFAASDSVT